MKGRKHMAAQRLTWQELEAEIRARLSAMSEPGTYDFDTWLACNQALVQIQQKHLLQAMHELLNEWNRKGVPVRW
jgi:hypothetical protein